MNVSEQSGASNQLLAGKTCVIMGVANKWSIGYAAATAMAEAGAKLVITYREERSKREADQLVALVPGSKSYKCNVESDEDLDALGASLAADFGTVDAFLHSVAFAPPGELRGRFADTTREGFAIAHNVSVYSLIAASQRIAPLMSEGGSIMTLSYLGSERVFPGYNVMGVAKAALEATVRYLAYDLGDQKIRVNAISPGPIKTAKARGVPGFMNMKNAAAEKSPIKGDFGAEDVAGLIVFLSSDWSKAITGETIIVDNGFHALGAI